MDKPLEQSKKTTKEQSIFRLAIQKNSQVLALFAIACTAIVGLINELTKDQIKAQAQQQLLKTLHSIIEPKRYNNDITKECVNFRLDDQKNDIIQTAYIARNADNVIAVAMTATATNGYNGNIDLIVAINNIDDSISGVRVLRHKETPGLGDKIELRKSDWILSFSGKKVLSDHDSRWAVTKDNGMFDQFTGATITPRAVVQVIEKTVLYFQQHKQELLTKINACNVEPEQLSTPSEESDDK